MSSHLSFFLIYLLCLQINMLLNFSAGDDCTCPEELQDELQGFHDDLRLHCGTYIHHHRPLHTEK